MWLDLEWTYSSPDKAFSEGRVSSQVRQIVHEVFKTFESGSIQQVIYQIGTRVLAEIPSIAEIHLEANNRTWDTIAERRRRRRLHRCAAALRVPRAAAEEIDGRA